MQPISLIPADSFFLRRHVDVATVLLAGQGALLTCATLDDSVTLSRIISRQRSDAVLYSSNCFLAALHEGLTQPSLGEVWKLLEVIDGVREIASFST